MLRDILQSKEKSKLQQQHERLGDNNNTLKTFDTVTNPSPLNNFCTASDSDSHEMMNSLMRGKSSSSKANSEDNDAHSENYNNLSGDESDLDSAYGPINCGDDVPKENDTEQDDATSPADNLSPSDSKEAKRARVENILTTIRQSPQAGFDSLAQASYEMKRQKRKQPQPQQHDVKSLLAPEPKYRKVERMVLQEHIRQLQEQLHAVKRSFHQISSQCDSDDDDDKDLTNGREDLENEETASPLHDNFLRASLRDKDATTPATNGLSPRGHTRDEPGMFSSTPLRFNGKSLGEGLGDVTHVLRGRDSHVPQIPGFALPAFTQQPGLQRVALTLKSEILQAVTQAVDSAVSTVLEKHAGCMNEQQQPDPHKAEIQSQQQQQQPQQTQQQHQ